MSRFLKWQTPDYPRMCTLEVDSNIFGYYHCERSNAQTRVQLPVCPCRFPVTHLDTYLLPLDITSSGYVDG